MSSKFSRLDFLRYSAMGAASAIFIPSTLKAAEAPKKAKKGDVNDCINLGFSGNAKAEDEMAQYIKALNMSLFVYDYDHNAPTLEHLSETHSRMFATIRQAQPELPILLLSRPKYRLDQEEKQRLEVIKSTYDTAISDGDRNVYFMDGPTLMKYAKCDGTVDGCHPNDLGFYSMAKAILPLARSILNR